MLTRRFIFAGLTLATVLAMAACEAPRPQGAAPTRPGVGTDLHIPPFAKAAYQPFSREAAVQIAQREWRAFGSPVVVPNTELPFNNERAEGLWQRVGEYWWLGLSMGYSEQGFTGKHDANGRVFSEREDGNYAWSAAFIGYVMRMAGARDRFLYSPNHSDYINASVQRATGVQPGLITVAERPGSYVPQRGDLICYSRGGRPIRYDDLPTGRFPGHCDIVVAVTSGSLDVIGGNVDNSVSMKRIPVAGDGRLVTPDGNVVDPDHAWFVVIRVLYDT